MMMIRLCFCVRIDITKCHRFLIRLWLTVALPTMGHLVTPIKCLVIYHFATLPQNGHKWIYFKIHFARETNKGPPILTNQKKPRHA